MAKWNHIGGGYSLSCDLQPQLQVSMMTTPSGENLHPALGIDDEDLGSVPLLERKRRLLAIMPKVQRRVRYMDHIHECGGDLLNLACDHDLEGIVAKWTRGSYQRGGGTSWLKIKNPDYSQMEGRAELFEPQHRTGRRVPPVLSLI